jgi:hypothetical protein
MSVMLEEAAGRRIREDKIPRFLIEGTVSETGSDFFRALVRSLSEALQTYGAGHEAQSNPSTWSRPVGNKPECLPQSNSKSSRKTT